MLLTLDNITLDTDRWVSKPTELMSAWLLFLLQICSISSIPQLYTLANCFGLLLLKLAQQSKVSTKDKLTSIQSTLKVGQSKDMEQEQLKTLFWCHSSDKVDPILSSLNYIRGSLSTLNEHVAQLEQRVGANEDNLDVLSSKCQTTWKKQLLLDKVEDLENRSRALNFRFVGIPEYWACVNGPPDSSATWAW